MFERWRRLRPERGPLWSIFLYDVCRRTCLALFRIFYRARARHPDRVPATGAVLIAANHQSYIDPPLVGGFVTQRQCNFIARAALFRFRPFGWLIRALNSVPIKEQSDTAAIKEVIRLLQDGHAVVIFPEGGRCDDGAMHEFKRGVALLMKKARCPVVPAAVEGCFDAWSRHRRPRLFGARVAVEYAHPIPHEELLRDGPDAALRRLEREIDAMRLRLRAELREQTGGRCPRPGPGDGPLAVASTAPDAAATIRDEREPGSASTTPMPTGPRPAS